MKRTASWNLDKPEGGSSFSSSPSVVKNNLLAVGLSLGKSEKDISNSVSRLFSVNKDRSNLVDPLVIDEVSEPVLDSLDVFLSPLHHVGGKNSENTDGGAEVLGASLFEVPIKVVSLEKKKRGKGTVKKKIIFQ